MNRWQRFKANRLGCAGSYWGGLLLHFFNIVC